MHDFQGYFSRTLSFNFQDFPGPNRFSKTFQVLEFSRKKSRTLQEAWEPWSLHATVSRTLSFNFQDFPRPTWFSRTFQVLEFSRKNPGLYRRCCQAGPFSWGRPMALFIYIFITHFCAASAECRASKSFIQLLILFVPVILPAIMFELL